jgi:TRAP-type C4-dicarboxylate transport system permease small subunit
MSMWIKGAENVQAVVPVTDIISMFAGPIVGIALSHFGFSIAVSAIAASVTCGAIFVGGRLIFLREYEKAIKRARSKHLRELGYTDEHLAAIAAALDTTGATGSRHG